MPSTTESLKPYLLIASNSAEQSISRIAIRIELSFPDRSPVQWVHTMMIRNIDGIERFPPRQDIFLFPGIVHVGPGYAMADSQQLDNQLSELRKAQHVSVVLDAVILDSGLVLGPDKTGASTRYSAEQSAISDMLEELKKRDDSSLKQYLHGLPSPHRSLSLSVVEGARDYEYHYQQMQQRLAGFILYRNFNTVDAVKYLTTASSTMKELTLPGR